MDISRREGEENATRVAQYRNLNVISLSEHSAAPTRTPLNSRMEEVGKLLSLDSVSQTFSMLLCAWLRTQALEPVMVASRIIHGVNGAPLPILHDYKALCETVQISRERTTCCH